MITVGKEFHVLNGLTEIYFLSSYNSIVDRHPDSCPIAPHKLCFEASSDSMRQEDIKCCMSQAPAAFLAPFTLQTVELTEKVSPD